MGFDEFIPFTKVIILPNYTKGFIFMWEISNGFSDPLPWNFTVEEGPSHTGPWTSISPTLINTLSWAENNKRLLNKDQVLFFRITLITPNGEYTSAVRTPYADVKRREFLIIRDIMRRELLQQSGMSGVMCKLFCRATFGPVCTDCKDPITGDILNSDCDSCYGTGRKPGYYGPYDIWLTITPRKRDNNMAGDGTGTRQQYTHNMRMIGFPYVKGEDVVVDITNGKRYYVDIVNVETEIRRVPIIQTLIAHEAPVSEPIYKLDV